jgi:hypothetical protein
MTGALVAGDAEQVASVVRELVQEVAGLRELPLVEAHQPKHHREDDGQRQPGEQEP